MQQNQSALVSPLTGSVPRKMGPGWQRVSNQNHVALDTATHLNSITVWNVFLNSRINFESSSQFQVFNFQDGLSCIGASILSMKVAEHLPTHNPRGGWDTSLFDPLLQPCCVLGPLGRGPRYFWPLPRDHPLVCTLLLFCHSTCSSFDLRLSIPHTHSITHLQPRFFMCLSWSHIASLQDF